MAQLIKRIFKISDNSNYRLFHWVRNPITGTTLGVKQLPIRIFKISDNFCYRLFDQGQNPIVVSVVYKFRIVFI